MVNRDLYLDFEVAVAAWCQERPDILAAVVIGSRGRPESSADDYSDLDLLLFTLEPGRYQESYDWLNRFGDLWIAALSFVGAGDPEWMAYFAPGLKADFLFAATMTGQSLHSMLEALPYQQVLTRGYRILYQAEPTAGKPVDSSAKPVVYSQPTEWEFHQKVNATLLTAERFVKFSNRNDLWRSSFTYHSELKTHLLAFAEWHARIVGRAPDTWYEGRHLADWADRRVIDALPDLQPELGGQEQALLAFLDLLSFLAGGIAAQLGYAFPTRGQRIMIDWLKSRMREAPG